jgi:hypothetical protein
VGVVGAVDVGGFGVVGVEEDGPSPLTVSLP